MKKQLEKLFKTPFKKLWEARSPYEQKSIIVLSSVLVFLFYVTLVLTANKAHTPLLAHVINLREQAKHLDQQAIEYVRLSHLPPVIVSSTDLLTLVQGRINHAGLAEALQKIDAPDADHVVVTFGAVSFAEWLNWIIDLKSQHIHVDTCRTESLSTSGLVTVTATLVRTHSP